MATKTLTITEEAYERLARLKKENESFSKVIERITNKRKLSEFAGILSEESANELEDAIKEGRIQHRKSSELRFKRLFGED